MKQKTASKFNASVLTRC